MRAIWSKLLIFPALLVLHVPGFSDGLNTNKPPTLNAPVSVDAPLKSGKMAEARTDSLTIVKHGYQHRQQIITGSVVMACLALIMVTMNNYNPR
jgi:hypothetical protein